MGTHIYGDPRGPHSQMTPGLISPSSQSWPVLTLHLSLVHCNLSHSMLFNLCHSMQFVTAFIVSHLPAMTLPYLYCVSPFQHMNFTILPYKYSHVSPMFCIQPMKIYGLKYLAQLYVSLLQTAPFISSLIREWLRSTNAYNFEHVIHRKCRCDDFPSCVL